MTTFHTENATQAGTLCHRLRMLISRSSQDDCGILRVAIARNRAEMLGKSACLPPPVENYPKK